MKLTELEPQFVRYESRIETYEVIAGDSDTWHERGEPTESKTGPREYTVKVDPFDQAQGIWFLCPKCIEQYRIAPEPNQVGCHQCQVTFENRGVANELGTQNRQGPVRWNVSGTGFHDLTITPSIFLIGGCGWHGFITNGEIIFA